MKNILLLGSALGIGGAERVIANLAQHLDRSRFSVMIGHFSNEGVIGAELRERGFAVVEVPVVRRGIQRYLSFLKLDHVLKVHQIELVHTHTTSSLTDAALCRYLGSTGVQLVHTFHFGNYPNRSLRYRVLERMGSRVTDRLVAVGCEQKRAICATYGLPSNRLEVIVNGVEAVMPEPDREWRNRLGEDDDIVIGTICTFIEQKGLPDLLRVARVLKARNERARFVVVGDGPLRAEVERQCVLLGLEGYVLLAGWKPNAAVSMMPLFDVFFQPSLWEAMSMVVLEAMAAAKPVVVTDVGDNRYVVGRGETGLVVPPRDIAAMATALQELIRSRELRNAFGEAGRRRYEEKYTAKAMTRRYEALYSSL